MNTWVSIININENGIKEPTCGCHYYNINKMFMLSGYVKVWESFFTWVVGWVKSLWTVLILGQFCLGVKSLAWYIDPNGMNCKNGIKEPTCGYQYYNISQMFILSGYVKVRESFFTWVIGWVKSLWTILILGRFCLGVKTLAWYIDPNGIKCKNIVKNHILLGTKIVKSYYIYFNGIEKNDIMPT